MIIRKPYAFLIKHFKKIHIFMLIIALYVYVKNTVIYSFLRDFLSYGTYDAANEAINKYASVPSILATVLLIAGSVAMILLLRHKEKPWKLYLIPAVQYTVLFLGFSVTRSFFIDFASGGNPAQLRMWRDLIFTSEITQVASLGIFMMRVLGMDLRKFNFNLDEEYLEMDLHDRDEFEINVNIDKHSFKRLYKKTLRYLNYFYEEHKLICQILVVIAFLFLAKSTYDYLGNHKSFKQGDIIQLNAYTMRINKTYYTDKAFNGDVISKDSAFVILDLSIRNDYSETRNVNLDRFHVMNRASNSKPEARTYATEFEDLGTTYASVKIKPGKTTNMILIFKVDRKLNKDNFVLYYQNFNTGETGVLRKIKLKVEDLSNIKDVEIKQNEIMELTYKGEDEEITFDEYQLSESVTYSFKSCSQTSCKTDQSTISAPAGKKIVKLSFSSIALEGNDLAMLTLSNANIKYTVNGKEKKEKVSKAINTSYNGKYIYMLVPQEIENADEVKLEYTIRDTKYINTIYRR